MVVKEIVRVAVREARAAEVAREAERHAAGLVEPVQLGGLQVDLDRGEIVGELACVRTPTIGIVTARAC